MKKHCLVCFVSVLFLTGCTSMQRGGLIGSLLGAGAGAGIGAAGGGVGVAIGAGAGAGAGALLGAVAGEVYEVHRIQIEKEAADFDRATGAAMVRTRHLAEYEKRLALMEARNRELIAQNERLIAASYTLADAIGADGQLIRVHTQPEGVMEVSIVSEVLFEPGTAQLREAVFPVLDEIGLTISEDYPNFFTVIEGHTDPSEVTEDYLSHWELSSARALSVLHYFSDRGHIPPHKMAIASYGHHRPVRDTRIPESQRLNRRVTITIMPDSDGYRPLY